MRVLIVFTERCASYRKKQMDRVKDICCVYAAAGHVPICLGLMGLSPNEAPCVHSRGTAHGHEEILENWNERLIDSGAIDMIVSDDSIHSGYELRLDILASEQGISHVRFDPRELRNMGLGALCPSHFLPDWEDQHPLREGESCAST